MVDKASELSVHIDRTYTYKYRRYYFYKRVLDIISAVILIVAFLPFWVVVPIAIWIDTGLPILFRHRRLGKFGREFYLLKFRSMVQNADEILHKKNKKLLKKFKENDWKIENDPRITRAGKTLRRLTIDEFPQLFNVLKGEMSIVGPRAYLKKELIEQTNRYPSTKKYLPYILSIKPGITGVWQVNGRNDIPFKERARMDAEYAKRHDILEDIKILLKTPQAMLSRW